MNKAEKSEYIAGLEQELQSRNVYELFERLMRELIVYQPENPIDFLIDKLSTHEGKKVFIVGPPGSNVRELALSLSDHLNAEVVSVGDLLQKEVSKKTEIGQKAYDYMKNMLYASDDLVVKILHEHLQTLDKTKNVIVEGFPKTLYQSMAMVKGKIIPDLFIVVNFSESQCEQFIKVKFSRSSAGSQEWADNGISDSDRDSRGKDYLTMYHLNLRELKHSYKNNIVEVDGTKSQNDVLQELARLIKFKIKPLSPKRSYQILVIGRSGSGRSTIMRTLSDKLGLIGVSSAELLVDQVRRKTELGQRIFESMRDHQLISDEIVSGVIKARLGRADCKLNGYLLEGFPKNQAQAKLIEGMAIRPNFIIEIDCSETLAIERISSKLTKEGKVLSETELARVKDRVSRGDDVLEHLQRNHSAKVIRVDAQQSLHQIIEKIVHEIELG